MAMGDHSIAFPMFFLLRSYLSHHLDSLIGGGNVNLGLRSVGLVHSNQFLFAQFMNGLKAHGFLIEDNILVSSTFEVLVEIK